MSMNKDKIFGGILLVSGTAIGGGMLAVPISTAQNGFIPTSFSFLLCWFFVTMAALLLLEVNLSFPGEKDLISMVDATLGIFGKVVACIAYLLLLYALIAAYLTGSSAWLSALLEKFQVILSSHYIPITLALIFGMIVSYGTSVAEHINRYLMYGLIVTYLVLIWCALPSVELTKIGVGSFSGLSSALPLIITAFGFAIVIPSLTNYLNRDAKALRYVVLGGSLIPLMVYILWEFVVLGIIPLEGVDSFQILIEQRDNGVGVAAALEHIVKNPWITQTSRWFSIFIILTSFLGVSLALFHFLIDAFRISKKAKTTTRVRIFLLMAAYFPPLIMVLVYPSGFSKILSFAGIFVAVLLGILPAVMAWQRRYSHKAVSGYQVFGGKGMLISVIIFFSYVTYVEIANCLVCP